MASNATGSEPRRAPLAPSARSGGATAPSGGSARRASNRPPPSKSLFNAAPSAAVRAPVAASAEPRGASALANANPSNAADNARAMRDELVRAVMPELRTLTEHLVKTTAERTNASSLDGRRELEAAVERAVAPLVERAIAPLVAKQRELEAALADLRRAECRPQPSPIAAVERAPAPAISSGNAVVPAVPVANRPAQLAPGVNVVLRPNPGPPRSDVIAAREATGSWDLPSELNGSRRKRVVIWILALGVVLGLLTVVGLAILSNTGRYV